MHTDLPASADGGGELDRLYGERYYETYSGGPYEYEGKWAEFFGAMADRIIRRYDPRTVLDAGCGKGFLVAALRERGIEAYGIDFSDYAVDHAPEIARPHVRTASVTDPIEGRYDLITCIEVLEHLPKGDLAKAIDSLCGATDRILLSSTGEGEHLGEPSHLSVQPAENWTSLFAEASFFRSHDEDVTWVAPWAMLLERRPMTIPEVVLEYDRRAARDAREIFELRRTTLRLEQELEELQGRTPSAADRQLDALRVKEAEIADALTETLRVRDLLIVAERELGQAKGQIAHFNDMLRGYSDVVAENEAIKTSTTWRLTWKALGPYRKVRSTLGR